jgi:CheY-like chemotaxis protein
MELLLVDDDRIALELLAHQLTAWGYQVVTARNGADAWERFRQHD